MIKNPKIKEKSIFALLLLINVAFILPSNGQDKYTIEPDNSAITCSVGYLVAAKLKGEFKDFSGVIHYNPKDITKSSVFIKIKTASIETKKPFINRLIRSKRMLNSKLHPEITFAGKSVTQKKGKYYINGILDLHGIKQEVSFAFTIKEFAEKKSRISHLISKGSCFVNRKKFKVVWSKLFDKGGLLVRNNILIQWNITAVPEK